MSKTLVIAEKPSVGQDLARVLKGPFQKGEGWLEGPDHVITWAVGHLVQLADHARDEVRGALEGEAAAEGTTDKASIAILPFDNMSGDSLMASPRRS